VLAVEDKARERDFQDEHRVGGVRGDVVARPAPHDRHIGLGLRGIVQRDWPLSADVPAVAKGPCESQLGEPDGRVVGRALGLGHQQEAVDQLHALAGHEDTLLDELLVLKPLPPLDLDL